MPTATDWQNSILLEVGAGLDAPSRAELDVLSPNIGLWWSMYQVKSLINPIGGFLQYLYTKRHLINVLIGQLRNKVSGSMGGISVQQGDSVNNLHKMYKETTEEIVRIEKMGQACRVGVVQPQNARTPFYPQPSNPALAPLPVTLPGLPNGAPRGGQGDPNSPGYTGNPLIDPNGAFSPGLITQGG